MVYFTSTGCSHCRAVLDEVLMPLQQERGDRLQIRVVDILDSEGSGAINAANYKILVYAEELFGGLLSSVDFLW